MESAKNLKVTYKSMGDKYVQWEEYFDKMTEGWTPAKAQEVVVLDVVRDMSEMQEACDSILKPVNEKIAMYALTTASSAAPQIGTTDDAAATLAAFGGNIGVEE